MLDGRIAAVGMLRDTETKTRKMTASVDDMTMHHNSNSTRYNTCHNALSQ